MRGWRVGPLVLGLAVVGASIPARAAEIASGTYRCIAGGTRMMLTLGEMQVSGRDYTFTDPAGNESAGRYTPTATGLEWGDIGAITSDQILESGFDATPGDFWFTYKARPTSLPTTVACARV